PQLRVVTSHYVSQPTPSPSLSEAVWVAPVHVDRAVDVAGSAAGAAGAVNVRAGRQAWAVALAVGRNPPHVSARGSYLPGLSLLRSTASARSSFSTCAFASSASFWARL